MLVNGTKVAVFGNWHPLLLINAVGFKWFIHSFVLWDDGGRTKDGPSLLQYMVAP